VALDASEKNYVCEVCGNLFPLQYATASRKRGGSKALMRLHAYNNFRAHRSACAARRCILCEWEREHNPKNKDMPALHDDGMRYHNKARCTAYPQV